MYARAKNLAFIIQNPFVLTPLKIQTGNRKKANEIYISGKINVCRTPICEFEL